MSRTGIWALSGWGGCDTDPKGPKHHNMPYMVICRACIYTHIYLVVNFVVYIVYIYLICTYVCVESKLWFGVGTACFRTWSLRVRIVALAAQLPVY